MQINVKDILIKPISSKIANAFVKKHHYSGKVVTNSQLHLGAFYEGILHGVMSFGPSMDKSKTIGLVKDTKWNNFLELNRMAFDDFLPKNAESRSLSVAFRLIKKHYPHIEWVISFADGMQCGDGTIYRASGFVLTGFSAGSMWKLPKELIQYNGGFPVAHDLTLRNKANGISIWLMSQGHGETWNINKCVKKFGGEILPGYMLRYIYFLKPEAKERLTVPILPFSKIDEMKAGMYKGEKITQSERHNKDVQSEIEKETVDK